MLKRAWQFARIGKTYKFSSAHWLPFVREGHKCGRMHGHNYKVEVEIRGDTGVSSGFCCGLDFEDIDAVVKPVLATLDHTCLNDVIENPTAENLADWLLKTFNRSSAGFFYSVKVWETDYAWAMAINADGLFHASHKE